MTLTNRWGLILEGMIALLLVGVLTVLLFATMPSSAGTLFAPARTGTGAQPETPAQAAQPSAAAAPQRTIVVLGSGTVARTPDLARLEVGVETVAPTVAEAAQANAAQMNAVVAKLNEFGIPERDVQTTYYYVTSERGYGPEGPGPITGYRIANTVQITIRDVQQVSTILDGVTQAGANNIFGVYYGLDRQTEQQARAEARSQAVADVQVRAAALADLNDVQLGDLLSISEVIGAGASTLAGGAGGAGGAGNAPFAPGQFEITVQLQGTYVAN